MTGGEQVGGPFLDLIAIRHDVNGLPLRGYRIVLGELPTRQLVTSLETAPIVDARRGIDATHPEELRSALVVLHAELMRAAEGSNNEELHAALRNADGMLTAVTDMSRQAEAAKEALVEAQYALILALMKARNAEELVAAAHHSASVAATAQAACVGNIAIYLEGLGIAAPPENPTE